MDLDQHVLDQSDADPEAQWRRTERFRQHDARLDPEEESLERPWRINARRQFVPLPVAALLWGAAEAAHLAPGTWPYGAPAATGVYFVAAVTWWTRWSREHPENRAERRRWAYTVMASGGAWLLWAASTGVGGMATLLLAGGGAALMLPYWTRNSPWCPETTYEPEDLPEPPPLLEPVAVVDGRTANQMFWDTVVAPTVPAVSKSRLIDPDITDDYEQYTLQLDSGRQATGSAVAAAAMIASAFGRGLDTVQVIPHPSGEQDKAIVRLAKANPLAVTRFYPGPAQAIDLTGGNIKVLVAYRADGSPVWWTFYLHEWGALGGAVFGDTGSGKSMLLRVLLTSAAYTGLIATIVACPQGGQSYPMWIKHGHWPAADADEIMRQARALAKAHRTRGQINRLRGREVHVPTPDEPMILWVVDEIHKMMEHPDAAEFYEIADMIEREGRKTCCRMLVADQDPSVPATFHNRMPLRRSLLAAQCYCLRLGGDVSGMLPGTKLNPTSLPQKWPDGTRAAGLGVVHGEAEMSRVVVLKDQWALAEQAPKIAIERAVAKRMGNDYLERFTRALAEDAVTAAELQVDDPELVAELLRDNPELAAALPAAQAELTRRAAASAPAASNGQPVAANVRQLFAPGVPVYALPVATPSAPEKWTCLDAVRRALQAGAERYGDIEAKAVRPDGKRYSETAVRNALAELTNLGEIADDPDNKNWGRYIYTAVA